jgi:hypothetical protein
VRIRALLWFGVDVGCGVVAKPTHLPRTNRKEARVRLVNKAAHTRNMHMQPEAVAVANVVSPSVVVVVVVVAKPSAPK